MMKLSPLALLVLSGCPFLEVEAEVGEVCVTYNDITIDGVAGGFVQTSFVADDLGQLNALVEQDAELSFVRAELRAASGATSLGFVGAAKLAIASGDSDSALPTLDIIECDGDCLPDGPRLQIPVSVQHSAVDYVKTGSLVVDLELRGELPATAWTADVDLCMTGRVGYAFRP
jgi:hypothetical protein